MKVWLTVEEAGIVVQRSKWTIYKWIHRGKIKAHENADGAIVLHAPTLLKVEAAARPGRPRNTPSHNRRRLT